MLKEQAHITFCVTETFLPRKRIWHLPGLMRLCGHQWPLHSPFQTKKKKGVIIKSKTFHSTKGVASKTFLKRNDDAWDC